MDTTSAPPRKITTLLLAALIGATGLIMTLHGLGLISAAWANPNPRTPQWVFALLGIMLLPGAWLTYTVNRPASPQARNWAGYAFLALSLIAMHWLVFFSQGGNCRSGLGSVGISGIGTGLAEIMCRGTIAIAVVSLDLILLAVAAVTLVQRRRK